MDVENLKYEANISTSVELENGNKKVLVAALVLMIIGAVFSILFPLVAYFCSTISLILAIVKRKGYKIKVTIIIDIIALVVAVANSILGAMLFSGMMG